MRKSCLPSSVPELRKQYTQTKWKIIDFDYIGATVRVRPISIKNILAGAFRVSDVSSTVYIAFKQPFLSGLVQRVTKQSIKHNVSSHPDSKRMLAAGFSQFTLI